MDSIQATWLMPGVSDMRTPDRVGGRTVKSKMTTRDIKSAGLARWMVWIRWHFRTLPTNGIHPPQGLTKTSQLTTVLKNTSSTFCYFHCQQGLSVRNHENLEALKNNARLDK